MSAVVSLLTSPVAVNPVKVFVMPSNSISLERPVITALALLIVNVPLIKLPKS